MILPRHVRASVWPDKNSKRKEYKVFSLQQDVCLVTLSSEKRLHDAPKYGLHGIEGHRGYRPRSIYQYSSMAPRLSGENCKFFKFLLSLNSQKRLRYKENNTKYRSLTWKAQSHVRILIYRTWPIGTSLLHLSGEGFSAPKKYGLKTGNHSPLAWAFELHMKQTLFSIACDWLSFVALRCYV